MVKSIFQKNKNCYICGTESNLHLHHVFFGTANRRVSDENGFVCYLCGKHHNLSDNAVHFDINMDMAIKRDCQREFEKTHTREEFMELIGRNYLDDEESTEELREMCQNCEAYAGIEHDYAECKGKMCFNFYLAFEYLEWGNAFKGERW